MLELLVTLLVAGVLMMLTAPSVTQFISKAQRDREVGELYGEMVLARSEAVRRSRQVAICASADLATCSTNWNQGWIIYVDNDENNALSAGDEVIRRHRPNRTGLTITAEVATVRYAARGTTADTGAFKFVSATSSTQSKLIRVDSVGQPRICDAASATMTCVAN